MVRTNQQLLGLGVAFNRIRRITGYLSTLDMFNNSKKAEEHDRVKHSSINKILIVKEEVS